MTGTCCWSTGFTRNPGLVEMGGQKLKVFLKSDQQYRPGAAIGKMIGGLPIVRMIARQRRYRLRVG